MSVSHRTAWREYLQAARRKLGVARYHLEQLGEVLRGDPRPRVTPAIQAHFEGVMTSLIAAGNQVSEGLKGAFELAIEEATLAKVLPRVPSDYRWRRTLEAWRTAPIARDLRQIRNLAMHHHYGKSPTGPRLEVQEPPTGRPYGGPRDLIGYCTAALTHGEALEPILVEIEHSLARGRRGNPRRVMPDTSTPDSRTQGSLDGRSR
jgi:hypothetical protein